MFVVKKAMENKQLFALALGEIGLWEIGLIQFKTVDGNAHELHIELGFPSGSLFQDGHGIPCNAYDIQRHTRRHMNFFEHRYIAAATAQSDERGITAIGIDETSKRKGHDYITLGVDLARRRVFKVVAGKDATAVSALAEHLSEQGSPPEAVTEVCIDMSPAFIKGVGEAFAGTSVTFDRFHVMKEVNKSLDELRKAEQKECVGLKRQKYTLLHNRENLSQKRASAFKSQCWCYQFLYHLLWTVVIVCSPVFLCLAQTKVDTVRLYEPNAGFARYSGFKLVQQIARFDFNRKIKIKSVNLFVGANKNAYGAKGLLRFFASEAGHLFPIVQNDIIKPIEIQKDDQAIQKIQINFSEHISVNQGKVFVSFESQNPNIYLLSDKKKRSPLCENDTIKYYNQILKVVGASNDRQWVFSEYGIAIELVVESEETTKKYFVETPLQAQYPSQSRKEIFQSIAWSDVDDNGYQDVLSGNQLWYNTQGAFDYRTFESVDSNAIGIFSDINNDKSKDVVFIDRKNNCLTVAIQEERTKFILNKIYLKDVNLSSATSLLAADYNIDGFTDYFIGLNDKEGDIYGILLINSKQGLSSVKFWKSKDIPSCGGAQWIDMNTDGYMDLFVVNSENRHYITLLTNNQGKDFSIKQVLIDSIYSGKALGCDIKDINNDQIIDFISSSHINPKNYDSLSMNIDIVSIVEMQNDNSLRLLNSQTGIDYRNNLGGVSIGDINNNGLQDILFASNCMCYPAQLYELNNGKYSATTVERGLFPLYGGSDAALSDYNNDGKLDISIFIDGQLKLFENKINEGNYVAIRLNSDRYGSTPIGTKVDVYCKNEIYTRYVSSGKGICMQEPDNLHYGIGNHEAIDSVVVHWFPNMETREVFTNIEINKINTLQQGSSRNYHNATTIIEFFPNPFSTKTQIQYQLQEKSYVNLTLFSIEGIQVAVLIDEIQNIGQHNHHWVINTDNQPQVSPGTYIYKLAVNGQLQTGKIVIVQ